MRFHLTQDASTGKTEFTISREAGDTEADLETCARALKGTVRKIHSIESGTVTLDEVVVTFE